MPGDARETDDGESHAPGGKAVVAALAANVGIAVMKFVGFAFTGSGSMLAEAVHSVADTGNQLLLLLGGRRARRAPDERHPFGFGRERFFWAFIVALMLFSVGALFSIFDGVEKLVHPHELESPQWAIVILAGAMLLEAGSFRTAMREARPLKGNNSWWRFIRVAKNPELPVVLLEDTAALTGLSIALAAVVASAATGEAAFDAIGSLAIGGLLAVVAVVLAVEMRSLLLGEAASPDVQRMIIETVENDPRVRRLIHLRTEHLGPDEVLVAAKIDFDLDLSIRELAQVIDDIEAAVRQRVPEARVMYLEPDVTRR